MAARKKKAIEPKPMFRTLANVTPTDGHMDMLLGKAYRDGYELASPPIFTHFSHPYWLNPYAVGRNHPHFTLLFKLRDALAEGAEK